MLVQLCVFFLYLLFKLPINTARTSTIRNTEIEQSNFACLAEAVTRINYCMHIGNLRREVVRTSTAIITTRDIFLVPICCYKTTTVTVIYCARPHIDYEVIYLPAWILLYWWAVESPGDYTTRSKGFIRCYYSQNATLLRIWGISDSGALSAP